MILREAILSAKDFKLEPVKVADVWPDVPGGVVYVRSMNGNQRDAFEQWCIDCQNAGKIANARGMLAALTVCDENGVPLFRPEEANVLGMKSAAALDRIFAVAQRINGLTNADVEELEKNSGSGPTAASTSASQGT